MVPINDLTTNCQKYGGRIAIIVGTEQLSYSELFERISGQAALLAGILQPGDRLALLCANTTDFITLSLAAELIGVIRVPINIKSTPSEIAMLLEDCCPGLVVYEVATGHLLADVQSLPLRSVQQLRTGGNATALPCAPLVSDRCSITYTSGSTGKPKGVVLTHGNWHYVFANMLIDRNISETDVLGFVGPLSHAGWSYLYAALLRGARSVIFDAGDVDGLLAYARTETVTIVTCVPTVLSRLVGLLTPDHPLVQTLKWVGIGGAPTCVSLLARARSFFGNRIVLNYGQTEAMMTCAFHDFAREADIAETDGLIGRAYIHADVAIMAPDGRRLAPGDIGEICVRGPHTMLEYWGQPALTVRAYRDGFILTGDLGVAEPHGLLRIVGRAKDIIISGGFNIYPQEVEAAVSLLADIDEVAVLGLPSEEWGEKVVCVFSSGNGQPIAPDALRAVLKPRLGIKTPKEFHQLPALPKAPTGKIDKKALRVQLEAAT